MEKNKKRRNGIILAIAFMLPIIGRLIGQWQIQSEKARYDRSSEIMDEESIEQGLQMKEDSERVLKLQASNTLYKDYLAPYTMDFYDSSDIKLLDENKETVIDSIISLQNLYAPYSLIGTTDKMYIVDSNKKEVVVIYEGRVVEVLTEAGEEESAFLYIESSLDDTWKLQTKDRLYEDIVIKGNEVPEEVRFDITSGSAVMVE